MDLDGQESELDKAPEYLQNRGMFFISELLQLAVDRLRQRQVVALQGRWYRHLRSPPLNLLPVRYCVGAELVHGIFSSVVVSDHPFWTVVQFEQTLASLSIEGECARPLSIPWYILYT